MEDKIKEIRKIIENFISDRNSVIGIWNVITENDWRLKSQTEKVVKRLVKYYEKQNERELEENMGTVRIWNEDKTSGIATGANTPIEADEDRLVISRESDLKNRIAIQAMSQHGKDFLHSFDLDDCYEVCFQLEAEYQKKIDSAVKAERERILNELQDLLELSNKVKGPAINVKMVDILESLKNPDKENEQ